MTSLTYWMWVFLISPLLPFAHLQWIQPCKLCIVCTFVGESAMRAYQQERLNCFV
ncbi:hypothetical protein AMTRI_Chr02g223130 [Amborella trichopoda]